jgi:outer membrane protein assembly factor BamA
MSQIVTYNKYWVRPTQRKFFQARVEESGGLFGLWTKLDTGDLRRFVKLDLEYKHFIDRKSSTWAFRVFAGAGYAYGKTTDSLTGQIIPEYTLPFYKAYYGGGPYSLRAWRVRYAGLGSNKTLDNLAINGDTIAVERYGDIKLEGNVEFRFAAGKLFGIKLQGALFTDFGNVWLRSEQGDLKLAGAGFKFNRLYKDLAVASGVSARLDFDFFLIRFDWAYKVKNPLYAYINDGWFHDIQFSDGQFQLGIGYPF